MNLTMQQDTRPILHDTQDILQSPEPNSFELKHKDVSIFFETTSISGQPLFHYKDRDHDVSAHDHQIRQVQTEIGTIVSVTLKGLGADNGADIFTVFIPRVHLSIPTEPISTYGIYTRSLLGMLPTAGQLQTYRTVQLKGFARRTVS